MPSGSVAIIPSTEKGPGKMHSTIYVNHIPHNSSARHVILIGPLQTLMSILNSMYPC
jgi:hypothetical protein